MTQTTARRVAACITFMVAAACTSERAKHSEPVPAPIADGRSAEAVQQGEQRAISQRTAAVRRVRDTLFIRVASGAESTFVDNPADNDTYVKFTYVGTVAHGALHHIAIQGWESGGSLVVNAASGRKLWIPGPPVVSPDGRRFASSQMAMQICEGITVLEIYRLTDSVPVREWGIQPYDCATDKGWGASDEAWLSPDTLRFTRNDLPPGGSEGIDGPHYVRRPMLVVRADTAWRVVSPR
jgi:hypothetical protein